MGFPEMQVLYTKLINVHIIFHQATSQIIYLTEKDQFFLSVRKDVVFGGNFGKVGFPLTRFT
jgi:hypothetical protein